MKAHSHRAFGEYLLAQLPQKLPKAYRTAFLWGCVEPDINVTTYLRGYFRFERMRGHNYYNAEECMAKLCARLQWREALGVLSWFRLGKLVHYTADAFTHAHNSRFGGTIHEHRSYEMELQECFLPALEESLGHDFHDGECVMAMIRREHEAYLALPVDARTDVRYVIRTAQTAFACIAGCAMFM